MKALVGMRSPDSCVRYTTVERLSTPSPDVTPHDVLRRWGEPDAQLRWLCAAGHLAALDLDEMRQVAAQPNRLVGAAQTARDVADYLSRARTEGAAMAGLYEAGAWRCWRPMAADDIAVAEQVGQVWNAAHATSVRALATFDMSFRTTTARGRSLRHEARALASRALLDTREESDATDRLAILLAETVPRGDRTVGYIAKHYAWDTYWLLQEATMQRSHDATRSALNASIEGSRRLAEAVRERLVAAQNALSDAPGWQPACST